MARTNGYISTETVLTVAELREVLSASEDGDQVHVVTALDTCESRPIVAAMADDEIEEHRLYLYVDHPGKS